MAVQSIDQRQHKGCVPCEGAVPASSPAEARALILSATPAQLDMWRLYRESDARCVDRLLRIASKHPYEALAWMGAR